MPDEASFDEFYLATRGSVLSQLTAMTLDRELAADSVQEAYTRAWQRWSRHRTAVNPWRRGYDCIETHVLLVDDWLEREIRRAA